MGPLTDKQKALYIERMGNNCPVCKSTNIHFVSSDDGVNSHHKYFYCAECGLNWWEDYQLVGISLPEDYND